MDNQEKWDITGKIVALAVFLGMVVDGVNIQVLALALPQLMKEANISKVMAGALATYTFMGMGLGGILAGWLADRYGRVRVVWWSVATFSVLTSLIALTSDYWQIALIRFLSGFGLGSMYSTGNLLAAEYAPTRIRTTVGALMQAGWSVGYVVAGIISNYILPSFRLAAAFWHRNNTRHHSRRTIAQGNRSTELVRSSSRSKASREESE